MIAKYVATALVGTALMGGAAFAQDRTNSPAPSASSSSMNVQQNLKGNWRASKLVGVDVYNEANEKLGDISDVLVDNTGKINAVVIGIGGFLGVGQHDIAVSFDKLKFSNEPVRTASSAGTTPSTTTGSSTTTTGAAGGGMSSTAATKDTPRDAWYPDHATMSGTKEELKALPAFKYSDYQ
jgi:sporulation protein YlmC with PRC-barrel domain